MGEISNIFKFSCRKATELIEKKTVTRLSVKDKVQLFLHACICDSCRYYAKQSKMIDNLLKKRVKMAETSKNTLQLDKEVKEKILNKLSENNKG
jgi:hypothetical protein